MKTLTSRKPRVQTPDFIFRPRWFLMNRFLAVAGVTVAVLSAEYLFRIETIRYYELWLLTALLLVSNLAYFLVYRLDPLMRERDLSKVRIHLAAFTIVQINVDLIILTLMLHYSGGATNPFVFYYFFHTMLASILLSKPLAYLEALAAALLFGALIICEGTGVVPHYELLFPGAYDRPFFIVGMWAAFSSTLFIAVYMAESIMDRLRMHQRALEQALAETKRLETEKTRFLNVVAHDLKSPLASIETMVASTVAVHGDAIPSPVMRMLERIPIRTGELLKFIGELLDFSMIRDVAGLDVPFEQVDIAMIAAKEVELLAGQASGRNISITTHNESAEPVVSGNRKMLGRMVSNLISNAIRYTPDGGSVTVTLGENGGDVMLKVSDTGIGIPEEDLPSIFTDFFRARNARSFSRAGTGLGLSIVRSVAELHGGSVSVTSRMGAGTTFTIRLPAVISHAPKLALCMG